MKLFSLFSYKNLIFTHHVPIHQWPLNYPLRFLNKRLNECMYPKRKNPLTQYSKLFHKCKKSIARKWFHIRAKNSNYKAFLKEKRTLKYSKNEIVPNIYWNLQNCRKWLFPNPISITFLIRMVESIIINNYRIENHVQTSKQHYFEIDLRYFVH